MTYLFLFLLGLCVGSFLNVVIDRLSRGESLNGRSRCENCKRILSWYELVPVLSWVFLRGRCGSCRSKISFYYPSVELLTGLLFTFGTYLYFPRGLTLSASFFYLLIIFSILTVIFFTDLKYGIIPDQLVFTGVLVSIVYRLYLSSSKIFTTYLKLKNDTGGLGPYLLKTDYLTVQIRYELNNLLSYLLSAFALALVFWLIVKLTKGRGMGTGDVTLGFLLGLIVGFPGVVLTFFLGFLLGALVSLVLIFLGQKHFGQTIPLGPFLVTAVLITLFFGDRIVTWYINLL